MKVVAFILIVLMYVSDAASQEILDNDTPLKDGIYLSYADLKNNKPHFLPTAYQYKETNSSTIFQRFIYELIIEGADTLEMKDIWGICIDGKPYINQQNFRKNYSGEAEVENYTLVSKMAFTFTKFMSVGPLSYFVIYGYNGGLFYNDIEKDTYGKHKVIDLSTGEIVTLRYAEILRLISKDIELYNKYKDVKNKDKEESSIQMMREYNRRHPIYLME
jgi:hypothetical protein